MSQNNYQICQLSDELQPPETGKQSLVLLDDDKTKVIVFSIAAGGRLAKHLAPFDATIQIISGMAVMTVGGESVEGKQGQLLYEP